MSPPGSRRQALGYAAQAAGLFGVSRVDLLRLLRMPPFRAACAGSGRVDVVRVRPAGLLVGADGVHSAVRRSCWGDRSAARPTPYLAVRGAASRTAVAPDARGEYWGRGQLFGIASPRRPGPTGTRRFAPTWDGPGSTSPQSLREPGPASPDTPRPSGRSWPQAAPETSLAQRIWTTPPLGSFVRGRVALIGDAAHAMTPNLGRGACEALVDAVTLAELLNAGPWRRR